MPFHYLFIAVPYLAQMGSRNRQLFPPLQAPLFMYCRWRDSPVKIHSTSLLQNSSRMPFFFSWTDCCHKWSTAGTFSQHYMSFLIKPRSVSIFVGRWLHSTYTVPAAVPVLMDWNNTWNLVNMSLHWSSQLIKNQWISSRWICLMLVFCLIICVQLDCWSVHLEFSSLFFSCWPWGLRIVTVLAFIETLHILQPWLFPCFLIR